VYSFADAAVQMNQEYMLLCTVEPYSKGVSFVPSHSISAAADTCLGNRREEERSFACQKIGNKLNQMSTKYA